MSARAREPERREAGQDAALVGDLGRQDHVEGRDAVGGDEQQPVVVERVELAHLAAAEVDGRASGMGVLPAAARAGARRRRPTWRVYGAEVEDRVEVDAAPRARRRRGRASGSRAPRPTPASRAAARAGTPRRAPRPELDEREQEPLAEEEAVARLEVLAHPLGADDEPFDQPGEAVEHVVDGEERVGKDDPLGGRVRDVALVPERHVLEPDERVAADDARQPADPLGRRSGSACAASPTSPSGRGRTAPRPRAPRCARGGGARARSARARRRASASAFSDLGVAVALQDLRRARRRLEPEPLAGDPLHLGIGRRVRADGAGELADAHPLERALDAAPGRGRARTPSRRA